MLWIIVTLSIVVYLSMIYTTRVIFEYKYSLITTLEPGIKQSKYPPYLPTDTESAAAIEGFCFCYQN